MTEVESLKTVRFEPYASCTFCTVAHKACTRSVGTREGSNCFRKIKGGECQYDGIEPAAVEAIGIAGPIEVVNSGLYWRMVEIGKRFGETKWMRQIQREVLRFCIALLDHPLQDNVHQSAIIEGPSCSEPKSRSPAYQTTKPDPKYQRTRQSERWSTNFII